MYAQILESIPTEVILSVLLVIIIILLFSQGTQKRFLLNTIIKHFGQDIERVDKSFGSVDMIHLVFKPDHILKEVTIEAFRKIAPFGIYGSFQIKTRVTGVSRIIHPYKLEIIKKSVSYHIADQLKKELLHFSDVSFDGLTDYVIYTNDVELTGKILADKQFINYIEKAGFIAHIKFNGAENPQFYIFTDGSPVSAINSINLIAQICRHISHKEFSSN